MIGAKHSMNTKYYYTTEKNILQIIALLKAHGIKKIIASPGSSNVSFVASVQRDDFFDVYSVVDERSAAYMACGMAAESGEPVVLSCTMATASRNYIPGLTEAYYRKLPILALTAALNDGYIGQNRPQVIDRRNPLNDIVKYSAEIRSVYTFDDEWANEIKINTAILELTHQGGGPVHLDMETSLRGEFSCKKLPDVRVIKRLYFTDVFPEINNKGKICIFVGSHKRWSENLISQVDTFCEKYNAVVYVDHTSNYQGKYGILGNLICNQDSFKSEYAYFDLLIDIGEVSGSYMNIKSKEVWRVSEDGMIKDFFKSLEYVFEMKESLFFKKYNELNDSELDISLYTSCKNEYSRLIEKIENIPFSNIWVAYATRNKIPPNSIVHFGILNSLRSWNYFEYDKSILGYCNTGGFGIDGNISSLIGASLINPTELFIGFVGDLSFFYDMNAVGNRHILSNVRIVLINNGKGTEFKQYICWAEKFGNETDEYIAASGHFGNKSRELVKNYVESLGFTYYSAESKDEYLDLVDKVFENSKKPILIEVFTDSVKENEALFYINNLEVSAIEVTKNKAKQVVKGVLGSDGTDKLKRVLKS